MCSPYPKSPYAVKNQVQTLKKLLSSFNYAKPSFFCNFGPPIYVWWRMGVFGGRSYVYGQKHTFFRPDTSMSKLTCVWEDNFELAFGVLRKVLALDVSFHFSLVPCDSKIWSSRYDQNTTHLSWCATCWKIYFVNLSENLLHSFSDYFFDFLQCKKHVNLPKKIKNTINN